VTSGTASNNGTPRVPELVRRSRMILSVIGNGKLSMPANFSELSSTPNEGLRVSCSDVGSSGPLIARSRAHDRFALIASERSALRLTWWFKFKIPIRCQVCVPL